ncbi:MAG: nitroreductase family protein [Candidatus Omnitrophica bacterium]|nr:nitroreductase family protein [Candidatus Omnitrophota bacterium]
MDAIEVLMKRRSVRVFEDKQIPKEDLETLVDVARYAATARNVQPWQFVIVTDDKILNSLGALGENAKLIASSKACIAVLCEDTKYYLEDGCAATVNILNAAAALGIGSCWVAGDKKPYCREVLRLLNAPLNLKPVSLIALGYPQDKGWFKIVDKNPLKEILHWEKF